MKIWMTLTTLLLSATSLFAQKNPLQITNQYLQEVKAKNGLTDADLANYHVTDNYVSRKSDVTNMYLRQRHANLDIIGANINLHIKNNEVFHFRSTFLSNVQDYITNSIPLLSAEQAILATAAHFDLAFSTDLKIEEHTRGNSQKTIFVGGDLSAEPIPVELFYFPKTRKNVRLVWTVRILTTDHQNWWTAYVDAETGEILNTENWVVHCDFGKPEHCKELHTHTPQHPEKQTNTIATANTYQVFPLTIESPNHGSRTLETAPWNNTASPFGWHDTNAAAGAEFTITRGNNVYASDDRDADNAPGYSPDGGTTLAFEFPLDLTQAPINNEDAILTNLFYWNNIMHDVYYQYGFDEVSGNFQENNYGKGGAGSDFVNADFQDGSGTNNANFSTPGDGSNPRMQMFIWTNGASNSVTFTANSPAGVAGAYTAATAQFGAAAYNITGNVQEVTDGSAAPTEGCGTLNSLTGNIALIDRGNCQFGTKALNAENAGAIAVIICQNVADAPFNASIGNDGGSVTIPVVMISQADCATLRAEIPNLNVTLDGIEGDPDFDSSLDNGIIAHEYGHGISTRLTGGPSASCLGNEEQMGEGWSDWFGLVLTNLPTHNADSRRGIGTYVQGQTPNGNGIRPFPYSRNMSINPSTYDDIKSFSIPHGVGSVWCTMIWDLYWDLVDAHGYSTDLYNGTAGNNIAMNLIIEGCKLQGCAPGFIDGRDAIIAADAALYGGANECLIWAAFARRGLGYSADQGSSGSRSDGTEAFDLPPSLEFSKAVDKTAVDEGETLTYTMMTRGICQTANNVTITDPVPAGTTYVNGSANNGGSESGGTVSYPSTNLAQNTSSNYTFSVTVDAGSYFAPIEKLNDDMENGTANWSTIGGTGANFSLASTNPNSGTSHWFAQDITSSSDQLLTIAAEIPVTGAPELTFWHYYDTEATWDGGVVEISTDNGATWEDIEAYFTQNGYNSLINSNPASTLSGRPGFTGNSGTYIESKALMCAYAGNSVLIRFHFATDGNTGGDGWYIDDVLINETAVISNTATGSASDITLTSSVCTAILEPINFPIELLDFQAIAQEKTIDLNWKTANEINFAGFELLRKSEYETTFEKIAWIAGGRNNYAYTDLDVLPNTTYYYQLRSVDLDAAFEFSKIVTARLKGEQTSFQVFPNPVKNGQLYIQINDNNLNSNIAANISLINTAGQVVLEQNSFLQKDNDIQTLDVAQLPSGVYIIKITTGTEVFTQKILID